VMEGRVTEALALVFMNAFDEGVMIACALSPH